MFTYLILLLTIVPALELALLIKVGSHIGAVNTIILILLTGAAGAYLARLQGFLVLSRIQQSLRQGELPTDEMINGILILVGGILLLTPGFITDVFGFLCLIPFTRGLIKVWVKRQFRVMTAREETSTAGPAIKRRRNDVEDAEFHE